MKEDQVGYLLELSCDVVECICKNKPVPEKLRREFLDAIKKVPQLEGMIARDFGFGLELMKITTECIRDQKPIPKDVVIKVRNAFNFKHIKLSGGEEHRQN
mgnify:CR=1 FL=1